MDNHHSENIPHHNTTHHNTTHGNTTHGMTNTSEFTIWSGMLKRCYLPTQGMRYERYGARGIGVCERWRHSFENFFADMGARPSDKHSIDRIDVNGDYSPENCRWATQKEQCRNKRNNHLLTFNGQTKTITEWAEITGINKHTIQKRVTLYGMSTEEALTRPVSECLTYNGETKSLKEWASKVGISHQSLWRRLSKGWTVEDALTRPPRKTS